MRGLIKRARLLVVLILIFVTVVTYLSIFKPIERNLYESEIDSYVNLSISKFQTVENAVSRCIEGGDSLSSRTMILNKIIDYNLGNISFKELCEYTQPKYEDGANVLKYLVSAVRLYGNKEIAHYYNDDNYSVKIENTIDLSSQEKSLKFIETDGTIYLRIISEIKKDDAVLAKDVLLFDFTDIVIPLSSENYEVQMLLQNKYLNLIEQSNLVAEAENITVFENSINIFAILSLDEEVYISLETPKNIIYADLNKIITQVIITWFIILAIIFIVIYFLFFKYAKTKFMETEKSMYQLKNDLNKDKLTDTYSRGFLEVWNNKIRDKSQLYSLVMVDIDNFKDVNDKYGHVVGDGVLKEVALEIMNSIRNNDFLIRYGGDEFLILLNETHIEETEIITQRALERVNNIDKFEFKVSFSYGISELYYNDDMIEILKIADAKMYENKRRVESI